MVCARPRISLRKWDAQNSLGFCDTNGLSNLGQTTRHGDRHQKINRTWRIEDFAVLADPRIKLKENEKRDKYLNIARELKKKLWNRKVTVISVIIGALGTVSKGLVQGYGGLRNKRTSGDHPNYCSVEIGQNTEKSPGDLRRLAVTQSPVEKPSANPGVKNFQMSF